MPDDWLYGNKPMGWASPVDLPAATVLTMVPVVPEQPAPENLLGWVTRMEDRLAWTAERDSEMDLGELASRLMDHGLPINPVILDERELANEMASALGFYLQSQGYLPPNVLAERHNQVLGRAPLPTLLRHSNLNLIVQALPG